MEPATAKLGPLRESGHLCFPYESEDEKRATLVAFIGEGLARRERCLYVGARGEHDALVSLLEAEGVAAERARGTGALVLATQGETYLRSGRFDPEDTLALLEDMVEGALGDGFAGLRATGEPSGPLPDDVWALVTRYDALINERLARRPFVGLCRFDAVTLPPARAQEVLRTHPHALLRGEVCRNPFYERAEVMLGDDSRARLDWQLHQVRSYHRARRRLEARVAAPGPAPERLLSRLADELAEPLFALKREVHALGAALDETPAPERLEAAQRHLRSLSAAVDQARELARAFEGEPAADGDATPRRR
jgi:hypothetical protein